MSKQVTVSRWFVWAFVLVLGWSLFKTVYIIPHDRREAFRAGFVARSSYTFSGFDNHQGLVGFVLSDAEIDSILEESK